MKAPLTMTEFGSISELESLDFAHFSGDYNPLHLDREKARRYQFGSTVIHGINVTLRALNCFFATQPNRVILASLNVTFLRPAMQDEPLTFFAEHTFPETAHIKVMHHDREIQSIDMTFNIADDSSDRSGQLVATHEFPAQAPTTLSMENAESLAGSVPLSCNPSLYARLFPQLNEKMPILQCAILLATTNIVGMKCPGLHSIYASLELQFNSVKDGPASPLNYGVKDVDTRFSRVVIAAYSPYVTGEIVAYFRPAPVAQTSFDEIRSLVPSDIFAGRRALIIGGSRGLGEVIAKILAAGGAAINITYAYGATDAARVTQEISIGGGRCEASKYDIFGSKDIESLIFKGNDADQIYYMASPIIQNNDSGLWDQDLFHKYTDFYIRGLADVLKPLTRLHRQRKAKLSIYFPSTIFLDRPQKGFAEYAAAKAAAEAFAIQLSYLYPNWRIYHPRLPRMLTDQTSAITDLDQLDTVRYMLASIPQGER